MPYADSTLATCTHADLALSTQYTVTLGTGVADLAGNHLAAAAVATFTTGYVDTVKPWVVSSAPANGATGQATSVVISVTFSEPMDKASTQQAFAIVSPAGYMGGLFKFVKDTDGNYQSDYVCIGAGEATDTSTRPRLVVTYDYP